MHVDYSLKAQIWLHARRRIISMAMLWIDVALVVSMLTISTCMNVPDKLDSSSLNCDSHLTSTCIATYTCTYITEQE